MRISEAAQLTNLKTSNVRFYERKGLLTPAREADSKYRDYSQEDVKRIKQILLYRKMGVSIDTIYLLLNGQAELKDVLLRQKRELEMQMENLQGAMDLCSMILQEEQMDDEKLDQYLNYVHKEEGQGKHFAEAEELLEDIADFTRANVFQWNPVIVWLFQRPWIAKLLSIVFWGLIISVPVLHLVSVFMGEASFSIYLIFIYTAILIIYGTGFAVYRRERKKYLEEALGE